MADDYILGRNIRGRVRLNMQHFMYQKIFGYLLHPSIEVRENFCIADVGTGSGIWLLDMVSSLPENLRSTVSFHGFDVDISQAPPRAWTPSNIQMSKFDVFGELPPELEGKFDIINVRLFVLVVRDDDPTPILKMLLRMLKPGGWLQWMEQESGQTSFLDFVYAEPEAGSPYSGLEPGSAMKTLYSKVVELLPPHARRRPTWPKVLDQFVEKAGYEGVQADWKQMRDFLPWLAFTNDVLMLIYEEVIEKLPLESQLKKDFDDLYVKALGECWRGTAWNAPRVNVIGRRPLTE